MIKGDILISLSVHLYEITHRVFTCMVTLSK